MREGEGGWRGGERGSESKAGVGDRGKERGEGGKEEEGKGDREEEREGGRKRGGGEEGRANLRKDT